MELEEAIKLIRNECEKHGRCEKCPLYSHSDGECGIIKTQPHNWTLLSEIDIKRNIFF